MNFLKRLISDRALHKALTWRVIAIIITMTVAVAATGSIVIAGKIGIADTIFKIGLFMLHEKAWDRVDQKRDVSE